MTTVIHWLGTQLLVDHSTWVLTVEGVGVGDVLVRMTSRICPSRESRA